VTVARGRRWTASLAARLTLGLLVATALGTGAMGLYVTRAIEARGVAEVETRLQTQAWLLRDTLAPAVALRAPTLQARARSYGQGLGARVTVIAADGTVLADSERDEAGVRAMDNHAGRPEVRAALGGAVGRDVRKSGTLGVEMLYAAVPLPAGGGVVRLALPMAEVTRTVTWARRTVVAGAALACALALAVGLVVNRRVTRPVATMRRAAQRMAEGRLDPPDSVEGTDDVADLARALGDMGLTLRGKIATLETERSKVATILDAMVEGVIALDARGRVLLLNPGARAILGLQPTPENPVEGRPLVEAVRQKALLDFVEASQTAPPGSHTQQELELGPPLRGVLAAHAVAMDFPPEGRGTLLVLHDVSELRRLERVKTEFVANVSHELRTPLTCIRGYLETLLDGALEEPTHARRFLEVASLHADRLNRLVDDLLQLSNIETGRVTLVPVDLNVADVATAALAIFERQAAQTGVTLADQVPTGLRVRADRDRLAQILLNLVDNAVKFTPAGGRVTVSAAPTAAGTVEVRVTDTGIGIPSIDLPRLTERFYRVDKTRSRELGGTGLGLAIVKHLVQAHGGELKIESEVGRGTVIAFTLPAA
jgi:two-component system, OmpR family, phosphate regulon sensor histidine kinase PhoR